MAKKALALYQGKRDFKKTPEPSGRSSVGRSQYPRFVIQKHDASRLHYDLRLEVDGVFKSWAVTKGPSLDPADKRLAVEVEDHPLDYGDFEGTIPTGEYGGGTVMLWDRGFWLPDGKVDPAQALRAGELKFALAGKKLKGGWVLVRMQPKGAPGKRHNWLLIKHRDGFERESDSSLLARDRSVASGRSMQQIADGKGHGPKPFVAAGEERSDPARPMDQQEYRQRGRATSQPRTRAATARKECRCVRERGFRGKDLQARQGAVAGGGCRWRRHQARSRPLSRAGGTADDRAYPGSPMFDHSSPDGINGAIFFQRPPCRAWQSSSHSPRLLATANPTCRSTGSRR